MDLCFRMQKLFQFNTAIACVLLLFCLRFMWACDPVPIYPEHCFSSHSHGHSPFHHLTNESWKTTSLTELLQKMLQCYDRRVRSVDFEGEGRKPTVITVQVYILSIGNFEVRDMDFGLSFYFRQEWIDPRLAYGNHFPEDNITLTGEIIEQIWLPDTSFVNKKGSKTNTGDNFLVRLHRNGRVLYSTKNTLTMDCYMDLRNFPFDLQKCNLTLGSYGFTSRDVVYKWISAPNTREVEMEPGLTASEFTIGPIRVFQSSAEYKTGSYSFLKMELNFQRRTIFYIIQIYIPSGMIVVLSWISFWIDNQSIPARTALGITTVLAMTTLLFGVQSSLPSVPYIKAVDLFMIVSFANVFAALVEFAVVNYQSMREKERKTLPKKNAYTVNSDIIMLSFRNIPCEDNETSNKFQNGDLHKGEVSKHNNTNNLQMTRDQPRTSRDYSHVNDYHIADSRKSGWRCKITADAIDAWSRVLFPVAYLVFIIAYWIVYAKRQ